MVNMTIEELDKALEETGLDLSNPPDAKARDMILARHGNTILESKEKHCSRCWFKENNRCSQFCFFYNLPSDPVEVSKKYLKTPNNIQLFPFMCMFMIPVYEELTGRHGTMDAMRKEFKRLYRKSYPDSVKSDY